MMFSKESIANYGLEECQDKLTFIAFIFRKTMDPELLVKFQLFKRDLDARVTEIRLRS